MSDQNQYTTNELFSGGSGVPINESDAYQLVNKTKKELREEFVDYNSVLEQYISSLQEEYGKIENKQNQIDNELERWRDDKVNLIEIVGIFVAIFTFVSVEIQILRGVTDYLRVAGLSVLLFSGLSFFLLVLFFISENWVRKNNEDKKYNYFYKKSFGVFIILVIISLVGGIYLVVKGDYNNPSNIKNNQYFMELENKNTRLERKVDKLQLEIEKNKDNQTNKK